jgi:hypothetical protein
MRACCLEYEKRGHIVQRRPEEHMCVCVYYEKSDICIYIYIENVYRTIQHVTSLELTNGHSEEPSG